MKEKLVMLFHRVVLFARNERGKFGKVLKEKLALLFRHFVPFVRNEGRNRGNDNVRLNHGAEFQTIGEDPCKFAAHSDLTDKRIGSSTYCVKDCIVLTLAVPSPPTFNLDWWRPSKRPGGWMPREVVNPDPVNRDRDGNLQTVHDESVNASFLKEFVKERRKAEQQEAIIIKLQKEVEALSAALQKVSDRVELGKPAPRTVLNDQ